MGSDKGILNTLFFFVNWVWPNRIFLSVLFLSLGPQCAVQPLQDKQEKTGTSGREWNNSPPDELYHLRFTTEAICIALIVRHGPCISEFTGAAEGTRWIGCIPQLTGG